MGSWVSCPSPICTQLFSSAPRLGAGLGVFGRSARGDGRRRWPHEVGGLVWDLSRSKHGQYKATIIVVIPGNLYKVLWPNEDHPRDHKQLLRSPIRREDWHHQSTGSSCFLGGSMQDLLPRCGLPFMRSAASRLPPPIRRLRSPKPSRGTSQGSPLVPRRTFRAHSEVPLALAVVLEVREPQQSER